jgi:hypothetical protein
MWHVITRGNTKLKTEKEREGKAVGGRAKRVCEKERRKGARKAGGCVRERGSQMEGERSEGVRRSGGG